MAENTKCQRCGAPLPHAGPYGHCPACLLTVALGESPDAPALPRPSESLFGDYQLMEEISRGGMGVVYRARQISLNRPVALKMISEGAQSSPSAVARFQIEAEAAAQLNHPNIVPVFETGVYSGRRFLSMKLVEGGTLADKVGEFAARPERAAILVESVAEAVHHAHQRGVLHRDLKPSNILIDASGKPHVADFGLAKLLEEQTELTQAGGPLGTPAYMAPEQITGNCEVTTAADIYGLGAILYHLLTGRPPFQGATALEIMSQATAREPAPPDRLNPAVDERLATICLKCLSKEPARRYASAQALADDLARWRNGDTISAAPETRADALLRWVRRNRALAALGSFALMLLVLVAVVSTVAAFRIKRAKDISVAAEGRAREKLWESYLAQARAQRLSGKPGRRFDTLAAISNAAAIRRSAELRNECIAALALTDVRAIPFAPADLPAGGKIIIDLAHDRYAAGFSNGAVSVRTLSDYSELAKLPGTGQPVAAFSEFSADGKWLAVWYRDKTASVWQVEEARRAFTCTNAGAISFSPDSRNFAEERTSGEVSVVSIETFVEKSHFVLPSPAGSISWSPDGTTLAATGRTNISLMDTASGKAGRRFALPNAIIGTQWRPDGAELAAASLDRLVHRFDTKTGTELPPLSGHLGAVTAVSYTPDGRCLASGSWDGTMRLWDLASGTEVIHWPAGCEHIFISPDSRRAAAISDGYGQMDLFEIAYNEVASTAPKACAGNENYDALLFGQGGNWLATATENAVTFLRPDSMLAAAEKTNLSAGASVFLFTKSEMFSYNSNGFFLLPVREANGTLSVGETRAFHPAIPDSLRGKCDAGLFGPFDKDGKIPERLGASTSGAVSAVAFADHCYIFDMAGNALRAITAAQEWMKFVAVSPDGQRVATGAWNHPNVILWNAETGAKERELETGFSPNPLFSPDGKWLVTSVGPEVCFWRTRDWTIDHRVLRPRERLSSPLAFSGDGRVLAMAMTRSTVKLVASQTGETLAQLEPLPASEIVALALNSDSSELAITRFAERPEVWHLNRIRSQLQALGLDW